MKVCIPIEIKAQGGGFYFLGSWKKYLKANGVEVTAQIDEPSDILFTNHWMVPRHMVLRAMMANPDIRIVQRVDGCAKAYGRTDNADQLQTGINKLADLTIFQSGYARYVTHEKYGVIVQDGPIITNPVDIELFNPQGSRITLPGRHKIACVTWSTNPMKGAAKIYQVARDNLDLDFILCGQYDDAPDLANIHKQGVLDRLALAKTLRSCDVMATFSRNEACPNHVLEAMASGLPVLFDKSGGTPELVGEGGKAVEPESFRIQFDEVQAKQVQISKYVRDRVMKYNHPDIVLNRYLEEIKQVLRRPLHVSKTWRKIQYHSEQLRQSGVSTLLIGANIARRVKRRIIQ